MRSALCSLGARGRYRGRLLRSWTVWRRVLLKRLQRQLPHRLHVRHADLVDVLAVIADIPKAFVYRIARYVNLRYGCAVTPDSRLTKPSPFSWRARSMCLTNAFLVIHSEHARFLGSGDNGCRSR